MGDVKYPLCESVGLHVNSHIFHWMFDHKNEESRHDWIEASKVEDLLSRGVRVFRGDYEEQWHVLQFGKDTHQALLIDIKPAVKERAIKVTESQLRKALAVLNQTDPRVDDAINNLFRDSKDGEG